MNSHPATTALAPTSRASRRFALHLVAPILAAAGALLVVWGCAGPVTMLAAAIALVGWTPLLALFLGKDRDPFSPVTLLPFTFSLYALGPLRHRSDFSAGVVLAYLGLQLAALLAMRLGLRLGATRQRPTIAPPATDATQRWNRLRYPMLVAALALMLLAAVSVATQAAAFGGFAALLRTGYGGQRFLILRQSTTFGTGFEWWLLAATLLAFYGLRYRSRTALVAGVAAYLPGAWMVLSIGGRNSIVYSVIVGAILYHYGHRRIPGRVALLGLLAGLAAAQYYSYVRFFLPQGIGDALSEGWSVVRRTPALLIPFRATDEFTDPARSLLETLQYGGPGLLFGRSYLVALGAVFPFLARVFEQIGVDPSTWRLRSFYPGALSIGAGFGFSPVTEAYINFGVLGVPACLFLYGYMAAKLHGHAAGAARGSAIVLFACSLPVLMLDGFRIHAASFVYKWTRGYLMPWILLWLAALVLRRPVARPAPGEGRLSA